MCSRHEQLPRVIGVDNVRQKATVVCEVRGSRSNNANNLSRLRRRRFVAVQTPASSCSGQSTPDVATTTRLTTSGGGYLSSIVSDVTGCGRAQCPWSLVCCRPAVTRPRPRPRPAVSRPRPTRRPASETWNKHALLPTEHVLNFRQRCKLPQRVWRVITTCRQF